MPELSADAKQKVLELKRAYISSFADKIMHLEECWENIQTSQFAQNNVDELRSACHKIAGSSGSYELLDISHAAHELEQLCKVESSAENRGGQSSDTEASIKDGYDLLVGMMKQLLLN